MDDLYEKNKEASQKKYALLKDNSETAKRRTETMLRLATRSVEVGKYDEALDILLNNAFPQFEGGREMQDTYLNSYTLRGLEYFNKGNYDLALKDFETALAYPIGRWGRSRWAQFHYLIGVLYETRVEKEKAKESYQKCLDVTVDRREDDQEFNFYHGLALIKTGKNSDAKKLFEDMLTNAQSKDGNTFFRQFEGGLSKDRQLAVNHYLAGLAYEGLGQKEKAKTEYTKALVLDPGHVWSKNHLLAL
jgi:tetratricopeptide (TPR) repeat protein